MEDDVLQFCASVPATKPFFKKFVPKLLGSQHWIEVTEPLAERSKQALLNNRSSYATVETKPLESGGSAPVHGSSFPTAHVNDSSVTLRGMAISAPRPLSPSPSAVGSNPNLNKPLPKIRMTVDRTFSWGDLSSRASDSRGTILVGLAEPFSRRGSAATQQSSHRGTRTGASGPDEMPPLPTPSSRYFSGLSVGGHRVSGERPSSMPPNAPLPSPVWASRPATARPVSPIVEEEAGRPGAQSSSSGINEAKR
jgi:hypothetical protein